MPELYGQYMQSSTQKFFKEFDLNHAVVYRRETFQEPLLLE